MSCTSQADTCRERAIKAAKRLQLASTLGSQTHARVFCVVTFTPFGVCTCEKISREDERDEETISTTLLESDNYPVLSVSIKTFAHQLELGTGGSAWLHVFKPKEARQAQCETKPEATTEHTQSLRRHCQV